MRGPVVKGAVVRGAVALVLALPAGAVAEDNPSLAWIMKSAAVPLQLLEVGTMQVEGTEMIGVDSLTFSPSYVWPWFTVPAGPARVAGLYDTEDAAFSKAAILFSDAVPVCADDAGVMPVDTGTGAFLDRPKAERLDLLGAAMSTDCNLYDCFMAVQAPDAQFAQMMIMPDGSAFPAFSTGYGDGTYPVFLMRDATGAPTAAFADFTGTRLTGAWLDPPSCIQASS